MCTIGWLSYKCSYSQLMCTHTEVTSTMSTVYTALDYECRHGKKGTDMCSNDLHWVHTECSSSHIEKSSILFIPLERSWM